MKIIFSLIICISFSAFSQQVSTTLYEIYKENVKFDFSQNPGRVVGVWTEGTSMPYPRYYGASI
ncbi:MAG TPA: hypothetical protein VLN45_11465, partial [Ignavibacteriaceae bacterium]|nr:hypothetical protein [Ignavibacteriaceae bacterium]